MEKILVIDDDERLRIAVMAALHRHGFEVFGAADGTEGLAISLAQTPSLVLSDANMAGRNVVDVLEELRKRPATSAIPVILMTGEPQKAGARLSRNQDADNYLLKPFTMEQMLATVQRRLQRQAAIQQTTVAQLPKDHVSAAENIHQVIGNKGLLRQMSARSFRNILQVVLLALVFAFIQMLVLQHVCNTGMQAAASLNQEGLPNLNHLAALREQIVLFRLYSYQHLFARENDRAQQALAAAAAGKKIHAELNEIKTLLHDPQGQQLTAALDAAFDDLALEYDRMREFLDQDFAKSMKVLDEDLPPKIQQVNEAELALEHFGYQFSGRETQASFDGFNEIKRKTVWFGAANLAVMLGLVLFVLLAARRTNGQLAVVLDQLNEQSQELHLQTAALKAAANAIAITDAHGKIQWINHAFTKLTGYTSAEALGQNPRLLKSGQHPPKFYANLWTTISTGNVWHGELVNKRKDGSLYFEEMTITPVRGANGEIQNFIAFKLDVSARKQAEKILRESEARFHSLFENMPEGFACCEMVFDGDRPLDFIYREVNSAFEKLTGLKNVCGKKVSEVIPGIHQANPELLEIYGRVAMTGTVERFESYLSPLGIWCSTNVYSQQRGHFVAIFDNITLRKQTEQALAQERDLLQALMNNLPDHIYFKDINSRFIRINQALTRHLGLQNPAAAAGKSDADFFPQAQARQKLVDERCLMATGQPLLGLVEKSDTADRHHWVLSTKVPIYGADGKVSGLVGISRDITAFKEAELERQQMELQLRQSQKLESIGQLAAGIAHEINTPTQYVGDNTRFVKDSFPVIMQVLKSHEALLAAVKDQSVTPELLAQCEALVQESDLEYLYIQIPTALGETLEGVERVSKIVRAMKEFSHPGGKEKSPADLNKAIESTTTVARNEWKYVADLKLELEPELPPVPCFLGEFNQCILNLMVNAAHAIGDVVKKNPGTKGLITVQTRRDGDQVEIRLTDTGTGIPEAVRSKIFEPFFTTKDVGKGTGQGLAMIYGCLVKRHGGTVTFETEVGRGTTFIIRLPLKPQAGPAAKPPTTTEIPIA